MKMLKAKKSQVVLVFQNGTFVSLCLFVYIFFSFYSERKRRRTLKNHRNQSLDGTFHSSGETLFCGGR